MTANPHRHVFDSDLGRKAYPHLPLGHLRAATAGRVVAPVRTPRFLREAGYRFAAVRDVLRHTERRDAVRVRRWAQVARHLRLAAGGGFSTRDIQEYALDRTPSRAGGYVGSFRRSEVREQRNCPVCVQFILHKVLTAALLDEAGLPVVPTLFFSAGRRWFDGRGRETKVADVRAAVDGGAFVKPAVASSGSGAQVGQPIEGALGNNVMVQPKLQNASHVPNPDDGNGLNTLRITTARNDDGEPVVVGAEHHFCRTGSHTDNWAGGNWAAPIDLATGRVGDLASKAASSIAPNIDYAVPDWNHLCEHAREAHGAFDGLEVLSWDLAQTPAGPLIIEANHGVTLRRLQSVRGLFSAGLRK